jgi:GT2 family glycosyltransferase
VILVDNASEDGSVDFVREKFPEVRVVRLEKNLGFAGGNLAGYEDAGGKWIILLNNDTEADEGWLAAVHEAAQKHADAGSLACKMLYFNDRGKIDNCGFNVTVAGTTVERGRDQQNGSGWEVSCDVFGACAGAAAYRRGMLKETGFFDPDFFMTYEDVDLSFRAQLLGYRCIFIPEAIIYHRYRATMKSHPTRQVYFSQRNIEFVYLKNMPSGLILRYLPQRILYEIGAALYFVRTGAARPFLRAKIDVLRHVPVLLRKRREIQRRRVLSNAQIDAMLNEDHFGPKWKKFLLGWEVSPRVQPGLSRNSKV